MEAWVQCVPARRTLGAAVSGHDAPGVASQFQFEVKDDFMTDTDTKKDSSDIENTDEEVNETPVTDEPTQSVEEAIDAAAAEAEETNAFFNTAVTITGSPESSLDGAWLAFLKPDENGVPELWIAPTDGGEPRQVPVPFIPVEDVNPETGRIIRGPQWSQVGS